ncbi:MAG: SAM-dependent chlorinase/fluorinase [Magnetococcales bacterium]|nr:SAM-dependent chlorinase/fluorinase [Magnetococcales bacterium]
MRKVPPVVLLTDFGTSDPYVGQMKGVLHRDFPGVVCLDLYHELPPFSVKSGAWFIERCRHHMPDPAVWICVVDPGVGSHRRALAVQVGDAFYLGPDNGLMTPFIQQNDARIVSLDLPQDRISSTTFHGRDLFAPAAVRLLSGELLSDLGKSISDPILLNSQYGFKQGAQWHSEVMLVDRFGNLVSGLSGDQLPKGDVFGLIDGNPCGALVETFSALGPGQAGLVVGGFGTVEVVVNQDSAAEKFGCSIGSRLILSTNLSEGAQSP